MAVSVLGLDEHATFQEGHELDAPRAKRVPKSAVRKCSQTAAEIVLTRFQG
jgi:hypothetical protein